MDRSDRGPPTSVPARQPRAGPGSGAPAGPAFLAGVPTLKERGGDGPEWEVGRDRVNGWRLGAPSCLGKHLREHHWPQRAPEVGEPRHGSEPSRR